VIGNSAKAGVRFLSYDSIKDILKNKETGKLSTSGSLLAGMAAGACEATFAVTPSETVKTRLIDDARRAVPRFTGTANGVSIILKEEGLAGMYRGLAPTIVKQSANSAVRFTCRLLWQF
jgi:solute carrier family 25 citrate transporter 1